MSFGLSLVIIWPRIVKLCIFTFREAKKFKGKKPEDNISCLPILSKIIEKMVTKHLNEYLNTNNLLNKHQYGFQSNKSTVHALLHAIDFISKAFSNNELVLLVFLDLRKAFDLVDHNILFLKLEKY